MTHTGYKHSVAIALVLSAMVVTLTALLGRGALNLKGALLEDNDGKPSDVAVIVLLEQTLADGVVISEIIPLREEKRGKNERPYYAYQVKTSDEEYRLVKLGFNSEEKKWTLVTNESLHVDPVTPDEPVTE